MRCLILGCGYLGQRVARLLLADDHEVCALTRSEQNAEKLKGLGISPAVGDIMLPETLQMPEADAVIYSVGMDRSAGYSKWQVYVDGLRNVLSHVQTTQKLIYVSTTAVYGQSNGDWVDEMSPTEPVSEGGKICLEAERLLRDHCPESIVVRLAGIYGPQRLLRATESLCAGEPIAGNPDAYLNLIHVDDAAELVRVLIATDPTPKCVLGCDGRPPTRGEYYSELAKILKAPAPLFDASLPTRSGSSGLNKRCRSKELARLREFQLRFPSIADGLAQAVAETEA